MKKGCFIVPYFGKLPNTFPLFLRSVEMNADFDWLIFTDNEYVGEIPHNVRFIHCAFADIQQLVQSKFPFETVLNTPYKLCDYKCAYGYIFDAYISEYACWGYCDIDLIFGKISNFISDEVLKKYDKIGHLGHFSLYKNEVDINMMFMHGDFYIEVFTHDRIYVFDEWNDGSINKLLLSKNHSLCYLDSWTDIYPHSSYLNRVDCVFDDNHNVSYRPQNLIHFFEWHQGLLYDYQWNLAGFKSKEIMYVHLQKRKMMISDKINPEDCTHLFCVPDIFIDITDWRTNKFILFSLIRKLIDIKKMKFQWKTFIYLSKEKMHALLKGRLK